MYKIKHNIQRTFVTPVVCRHLVALTEITIHCNA